MDTSHILSKEHFYQWFKLLLVVLLLLNIADTITTLIGVNAVSSLSEGNQILLPLLDNIPLFLTLKLVLLSLLLIMALGYLIKVHHAFPKLWENEVALVFASLVVVFYFFVVSNNVILILLNVA